MNVPPIDLLKGKPIVWITWPASTVPAGIWMISLTPSSKTSGCLPSRRFNFSVTFLNKEPRVPSANTVTLDFKIKPGSKLPFGLPFLSRPLSPVRTPTILLPSYKASTAAKPGKILIPFSSHLVPNQRFSLLADTM